LITQLVKLTSNGVEVKISKRTGDIVEMRDVIDEIGTDATGSPTCCSPSTHNRPSTSSWPRASRWTIRSSMCRWPMRAPATSRALLPNAAPRAVSSRTPTRRCSCTIANSTSCAACPSSPETIASACNDRAPHRITAWLRELAAAFHGFYHDCYVVGDGVAPELTHARLWLTEAARIGLHAGLDVIGVSAPETM
jgi:arginyl-tRNA synthetase